MPHYKRNIRFVLFLILPILGFLLGWSLSQKTSSRQFVVEKEEPKKTIENIVGNLNNLEPVRRKVDQDNVDLSIFWEAWGALESNFLHQEKFNAMTQVYGATKGIVASLKDPYTVFMTPKETAEFEESISGEFEGIGAEIAIKDDNLVIIAPLKGAPAELAGLKAGDIVYKIDGDLTFGITAEEAVTKIRGPKGEKVTLTILREGEKAPLDITIVRDNIFIESVEFEMNEDIAVIIVSQFGSEVVREFREILPQVLLESPNAIILDIRNNGGGLLDASLEIATEFFDQKVIVKTKGRRFGETGDLKSGRNGSFLELPLVVLINEGSASASEIFAGAVQDHKRGVVIGRKTFGKGSVQNVLPLSDGSSLKVTIAEWLSPVGRSIHEKGIEPDIKIEISKEDIENEVDSVMERALELIRNEELDGMLRKEGKVEGGDEVEEEIVEDEGIEVEVMGTEK